MPAEPGGGVQEWQQRRGLAIASVRGWRVDHWTAWWRDGLDIWDSEFSSAERGEAFAPFRVRVAEGEPDDFLIAFLSRQLDPRLGIGLSEARELRDSITQGAIAVARMRRILTNTRRALLLLRVVSGIGGACMSELVRSVLAAAAHRWLGDPCAELLSEIVYIIFENHEICLSGEAEHHLESLISEQENFRPALYYAVRKHPMDVHACLSLFDELWERRPEVDDSDTWGAIASILNDQYGKKNVGQAVAQSLAEQGIGGVAAAGYIAAAQLAPFYPGTEDEGLFSRMWEQPHGGLPVSQIRGITTEYCVGNGYD